jgi:uncharacterized RDD family membrane protein YckC
MPMHCPYCRTVNDEQDSRCVRCGRRLHAAQPKPAVEVYASQGGAALAAQREPGLAAQPVEPLAESASHAGQTQPSLFRDLPPAPKVVPIPTLSPLRSASPLDRESVRRAVARSVARAPRPASELQQRFELVEEAVPQPRAEESLYCDASVALPTHRAVAAVADAALVAAGAAVFLGIAWLGGAVPVWSGNPWLLPGAAFTLVLVLYRGLYCVLNRDTPGLRFAGLRLVDFDGRPPRQRLRIARQFAGLMSVASAGVGLVWALVDEEGLTWHDHISKTFPTPH